MNKYIAVDLGASNGRVILGRFDGRVLRTEEILRFPNRPVESEEGLCWDVPYLLDSVLEGLKAAAQECDGSADGIGCVTWGADYGLLDSNGDLAGQVFSYRDERTNGMLGILENESDPGDIFRRTGAPFDENATLCQLLSVRKRHPEQLDNASCFLFTAGLLHHLLCGRKAAEHTMASESQLYNVVEGRWDEELCRLLGVTDIMPEIVPPATVLGRLDADIAQLCGFKSAPPVIATATHDTASAAVAVPSLPNPPGPDIPCRGSQLAWGSPACSAMRSIAGRLGCATPTQAFISAGTWMMAGIKTDRPVTIPEMIPLGIGNYGGADANILVRGIAGLWLVQECRRIWAGKGKDYSFADLAEAAEEETPNRSIIYPESDRFTNPADMVQAIRDFCRNAGEPEPETPGQIVRCILESLALDSERTLRQLAGYAGVDLDRIHIIGGGSRNKLLCRMIAEACGIPVTAGPAEATAIGNILLQAKATGAVGSLSEIPGIVRDSFELEDFVAGDPAAWEEARERFAALQHRVQDRSVRSDRSDRSD